MIIHRDYRDSVPRGLIAREWRETTPVLKRFVLWSISLGLLLTAICVMVEAAGGWQGLPFLTNLASSLAAASFGLPLGLIVLTRLTAQQTTQADRLRTSRVLVQAVLELEKFAYSMIDQKAAAAISTDFSGALHDLAEREKRLSELLEPAAAAANGGFVRFGDPLEIATRDYA